MQEAENHPLQHNEGGSNRTLTTQRVVVAKELVEDEVSEEACPSDPGQSLYSTRAVKMTIKKGKLVGKGTFGTVTEIEILSVKDNRKNERYEMDPRIQFVAKSITVKRKKSRELEILKSLKHENIVQLRFYFYKHIYNCQDLQLNLIFEMEETSLYDVIQQNTWEDPLNVPLLDTCRVISYSMQLLHGIAYIHSKGIAHRDIKPRNILIGADWNLLKICDMGSASRLTESGTLNPYICSRFYRAPELLLGSTKYSMKVDLWSYGCVVAEMVMLEPLLAGEDTGDQIGEVVDFLGFPSEDDISAMGIVDDSLFLTVGSIEGSLLTGGNKDERLSNLAGGSWPSLTQLLQMILVYSPDKRPHPSYLLDQVFFTEMAVL